MGINGIRFWWFVYFTFQLQNKQPKQLSLSRKKQANTQQKRNEKIPHNSSKDIHKNSLHIRIYPLLILTRSWIRNQKSGIRTYKQKIKSQISNFLLRNQNLFNKERKDRKPETKIWNAFETISLFAPPPTSTHLKTTQIW